MPYRCSAVGCRGNYDNGPRVSVFKFPNQPDIKKQWIQFIKRDSFEVTKNSRLCEQHFNPDDIIRETVHYNVENGESVRVPLPAPRLREGAIPSYLPGCPEYFSKQSTSREAPDDKRLRLEMQNLEDAIQQSIECKSLYDEERLCKSFEDLQSKINFISIPNGWTVTSVH